MCFCKKKRKEGRTKERAVQYGRDKLIFLLARTRTKATEREYKVVLWWARKVGIEGKISKVSLSSNGCGIATTRRRRKEEGGEKNKIKAKRKECSNVPACRRVYRYLLAARLTKRAHGVVAWHGIAVSPTLLTVRYRREEKFN